MPACEFHVILKVVNEKWIAGYMWLMYTCLSGNWKIVKQLNSIVQRLADQMPICSWFFSLLPNFFICVYKTSVYHFVKALCLLSFVYDDSGYLICIWIHKTVRSQCLRLLFAFYTIMGNHWILCRFWRYWIPFSHEHARPVCPLFSSCFKNFFAFYRKLTLWFGYWERSGKVIINKNLSHIE